MHPYGATQAVRRTAIGLNRRIVRTDRTGQSDVAYDDYYNHDWQLLETRKDGDADPCTQYVWGRRYIDDLVCRHYDPNVDDNVQTHYYLGDANMNVTCLIDANGDAVERYDYAPYGRVAVFDDDWSADGDGASDVDNPILFAGYRLDPGSALYHIRNRMYHPTLGRWLQRDPVGYVDGMSLYEYGRSTPPNAVDPTGEKAKFNKKTHCCENGEVVAKVSIWNCNRQLMPDEYKYWAALGYELQGLAPWFWSPSHSYICCSGPNRNCYGKQSYTKANDPIPVEPYQTGKCKERRVCPGERKSKCTHPVADSDYRLLGANCHRWAN